jgi:quercetin dioxygenase-like cupin family protein
VDGLNAESHVDADKESDMPSEAIQIGAMSIRFLVEGAESNGSVAVFEVLVPARANMPAPHSHDGFEETLYTLEGTLTWTVEGTATEVGTGEAICIPRGAVHAFDNRGEADAKALAIVSPGILGPDYFREAAEAFAGGGPPDFAKLGEVMRRHGLSPAPKPAS